MWSVLAHANASVHPELEVWRRFRVVHEDANEPVLAPRKKIHLQAPERRLSTYREEHAQSFVDQGSRISVGSSHLHEVFE